MTLFIHQIPQTIALNINFGSLSIFLNELYYSCASEDLYKEVYSRLQAELYLHQLYTRSLHASNLLVEL